MLARLPTQKKKMKEYPGIVETITQRNQRAHPERDAIIQGPPGPGLGLRYLNYIGVALRHGPVG